MFWMVGVLAAASEPAVDRIEARYRGAAGFSAQFVQVSRTPYGEERATGRVSLAAPDRFRWDFDPDGRAWVSNGAEMAIWDPVARSVMRTAAPNLASTPALALLSSLDRLDEVFAVQVVSDAADGIQLKLTPPRADGLVASVKLLAETSGAVRSVTIFDAMGNSTEVSLSGISLAAVPADRFTLATPAGATEFRAP